MRYFRAKTFD